MWWPTPANKTPRFFQPCPGNDENNLEPGMYGITDVSAGSEAWYRPFRNNSGDTPAAPIRIATATELAAYLSSSVFDANTILKADTDDTPVALPVGASTIVGRASTGNIAALTATQVATILNGLVTPAAHATTHETGGSDDINPAKLSGDTSAVGEKLSVGDGEITGSTDAFEVEQRDYTNLASVTLASHTYAYIDVGTKYIAITDTSTSMYIIDRNTGELIKTITVFSGDAPFVFISDHKIVQVENNRVTLIDVHSETQEVKNTNSGVDGCYDVCFDGARVLCIPTNNSKISIINIAAWTHTTQTPGTITNMIYAIDTDGTYVYTVDGGTTSYIRKYLISDGSLAASSVGFSANAGTNASIKLNSDGTISAIVDSGASSGDMQTYLFNSSLTMIFPGTSYISHDNSSIFGGVVYAVNGSTELLINQLPGLTERAPANVDWTNVKSSAYKTQDGRIVTAEDWSNAWEHVVGLNRDRVGDKIHIIRRFRQTMTSGAADSNKYITIKDVINTDEVLIVRCISRGHVVGQTNDVVYEQDVAIAQDGASSGTGSTSIDNITGYDTVDNVFMYVNNAQLPEGPEFDFQTTVESSSTFSTTFEIEWVVTIEGYAFKNAGDYC